MPIYEYMCESCGPFEEMRAMARHADPYECPGCGTMAPRVVLTAPRLAAMPAERRVAYSRNEQSAHAPQVSTRIEREHGTAHTHSAHCGCGSNAKSTRSRGRTVQGADGSKAFPGARPWMISH